MNALSPGTTSVATVSIEEEFGWRKYCSGDVTLWYKGWCHGEDGQSLAAFFAALDEKPTIATLAAAAFRLNGHFALAATGKKWAVAMVDRIRSIPLALAEVGEHWDIDSQVNRLREKASLSRRDLDLDAARSIAMAGYTINKASLYYGLDVLSPGEIAFLEPEKPPQKHRYYTYQPWNIGVKSELSSEKRLAEITLGIMERMLASLAGRTLIIPLSAGNDSRLIASAAKHLGYKNVRCFTYGRAGNYEAKTSAAIAERLGYRWQFVPLTVSSQVSFFAGSAHLAYLAYCDSCTAVPFVQDMAPMLALKENGYIPDDAVIANGNSGDYISGMHIPPAMHSLDLDLDPDMRWARIAEMLYDKHFALWEALRTDQSRERVQADLIASISSAGGQLGALETDFGLYEYEEFQDRQCKYVVNGQRIYEFIGHEWRLPLWDNDYLDFWETISLEEKIGQSLYVRMLRRENWGSVWQDIPINRQNIRPLSIIPLRWLAKAIFAPFGKVAWYRFQQQYLQYWMEPTCNTAVIPYGTFARDRRGARNSISWLAEQYLGRHGVSFSDLLPG